jgi:hypothetical protein
MSLKDEILANPFVERLRNEARIDEGTFELLCGQLSSLATVWSGQTVIDKQLVQELCGLPMIIRGAADGFRRHQPERAAQLDEMAVVVDGLILDALA